MKHIESGKLNLLKQVAAGIAAQFGSDCEVVVHDLSRPPDHSIVAIVNGHVSGREVGSTMDIMGIGLELDEQAATTDQVNLAATTPDGRQTKSSTFHMIGEDYNLALGINFDYTSLVFANRILVDLMSAQSDLHPGKAGGRANQEGPGAHYRHAGAA